MESKPNFMLGKNKRKMLSKEKEGQYFFLQILHNFTNFLLHNYISQLHEHHL